MAERAVLYSDPNCPFCYATEERLHALGLEDRVQWCGVQHAPHLPVPMVETARPGGEDLAGEVAVIRARAPDVAIRVPPGKPNTAPAIAHGAAALALDPARGRQFVRLLYASLWQRGADLSDPGVLGILAAEAGLPGLEPDARAESRAAGWERAWQRTGGAGVPLMVREDGRGLYGLVAAEELAAFLA